MRVWLRYRHFVRIAKVVFSQICKEQFRKLRLTRLFAKGFHVAYVRASASKQMLLISVLAKSITCELEFVSLCFSVCVRGTYKCDDWCMPFEALGRCLHAQILQFAELTQPRWDRREITVIQVQNLHRDVSGLCCWYAFTTNNKFSQSTCLYLNSTCVGKAKG